MSTALPTNAAAFTPEEIVRATGGAPCPGASNAPAPIRGVFTDSRFPVRGGLFVPLVGEHFDGHDYLDAVAAAGAGAVLVAPGHRVPHGVFGVEVADTLVALGDLAAFHRRRFPVRLAAVTGSVGKTSAKNLTGAVAAAAGPALVTPGNLNNLVGVPATLLGLESVHVRAVIEMGTNQPGEIGRLAAITRPDVGLITRIGSSHLEGLGSLDGVQAEKGALFGALAADAIAVVNDADARVVAEATRARRRLTYGGPASDVRLAGRRDLGIEGTEIVVETPAGRMDARVFLLGAHQIDNALAATATCLALGIDLATIALGLGRVRPAPGRMAAVSTQGGVLVLDDTYNANPESTRAALTTLVALAGASPRLAVLGEMLELGESTRGAHREIGRVAAGCGLAGLFACGPSAEALAEGALAGGLDAARVWTFADAAEAARAVVARARPGDAVLVKGSRGMRMEQVVAALQGAPGAVH